MANKIQTRRDTSAVWASVNPTLADGELAIETDTRYLKFGDGVTPWNDLDYVLTPGGSAPAVLSITGNPGVTATVGVAYSFTPNASGGTAPRAFSIASGALPAGLSINTATGAIAGTPTTPGANAGIVIRVTDAVGAIASLGAFTLTVNAAAAITISGTPATTATVGTAYTTTITAAGGTAPRTFSVFSGALPAGLTLNATTGVISGTPTTAGTSAGIVIRATDSLGATADLAAFTLTVASTAVAPAITTQPAAQSVTAPATATFTVVASGTAPLTYQWRKNGTNIAGATAASYTTPATTTGDSGALFSVVVTNSAGSVTSGNGTLTVAAAGPNTRARYAIGSATAGNNGSGTQAALLAGATIYGTANDAVAGTFTVAPAVNQYGWAIVSQAAYNARPGVIFFDGVGTGGWSGGGLTGDNLGASPSTSLSTQTFNDGTTTWVLLRQDTNQAAGTFTVS